MGAVTATRSRRGKPAPASDRKADAEAMASAVKGLREAFAEIGLARPLNLISAAEIERAAMGVLMGWIFRRAQQAMEGDETSEALVAMGGPEKAVAMLEYLERELKKMMRKPTNQEKIEAILSARKDVAEYLASIGKLDVFQHFTKDEICGLIRAAQEGVQEGLRKQCEDAFSDEIPF